MFSSATDLTNGTMLTFWCDASQADFAFAIWGQLHRLLAKSDHWLNSKTCSQNQTLHLTLAHGPQIMHQMEAYSILHQSDSLSISDEMTDPINEMEGQRPSNVGSAIRRSECDIPIPNSTESRAISFGVPFLYLVVLFVSYFFVWKYRGMLNLFKLIMQLGRVVP